MSELTDSFNSRQTSQPYSVQFIKPEIFHYRMYTLSIKYEILLLELIPYCTPIHICMADISTDQTTYTNVKWVIALGLRVEANPRYYKETFEIITSSSDLFEKHLIFSKAYRQTGLTGQRSAYPKGIRMAP